MFGNACMQSKCVGEFNICVHTQFLLQIGALPFSDIFFLLSFCKEKFSFFLFLFLFDCQESQNTCPCPIISIPWPGVSIVRILTETGLLVAALLYAFCQKLQQILAGNIKFILLIAFILHPSQGVHPCHCFIMGGVHFSHPFLAIWLCSLLGTMTEGGNTAVLRF